MNSSRRSFLKNSVGCALSLGALPELTATNNRPEPRIKLSISSYSYWHFKEKKFPIESVIDEAVKLGVDGIDILHRQMDSEEKNYVHKLKRRAFENGIAFTCLSIHQSFVSPDKDVL